MMQKYGVEGIPAMILVNANGEVVEQITDRDPAALAARIAGPSPATAAEVRTQANRGCSAVMLVLIMGGCIVTIGVLGLVFWKLGYFSSDE